MSRITQRVIAKELGIHVSTVSKALKGDPAIAKQTKQKIKAKANELGFRRDPMLSALSNYRRSQSAPHYRSTIAWIYNYSKETDMTIYSGYDEYFRGASIRCQDLGYKLEPFWVDGKKLTLNSLAKILPSRGIRGIIFAPQTEMGVEIEFPIEEFSSVGIGYSLQKPQLDIVTNDHFTTMVTLLDQLHKKRLKRIGCYLWEVDNERMGRRARSAFMAYSKEYGVSVKTYKEYNADNLMDWIRKNSFDCIITKGLTQTKSLLKKFRSQISGIYFAGYAISESQEDFAGMSHMNFQIGQRAVEWVTGKLERGQLGASEVPQRLLISGQWIESDLWNSI